MESWFGLAAVLALLIRTKPDGSVPETRKYRLDRWDALACCAISLIIASAFWRAANFYFLSDDFILLKYARSFRYDFHVLFATAGGDGFYRPLNYLCMALTSRWDGLNPIYWHSFGFALHAMNSILVFLLALRLGLSRLGACFASALFAVHGTRPEAVVWIAARSDLQATFFALFTLLFFIRSWDVTARWALFYRSCSALAMILAFLSKESSYTLPFLLAVFLASKGALKHKPAWYALAPFFAIAAGFLAWRWFLFGGIGGYLNPAGQPEALTLGIVPLLKTFGLRLWAVLFFPINWSNQPGVLFGVVMICYLAALLWLLSAQAPRRAVMVPIAFLLLLALPPLQQLLIGADLQKARVVYLPSVAFCLLLAAVAEHLDKKPQWAITLAILTFNLAALVHNLNAWEYASQRAKLACAVAATCPSGKIAVLALPRSLNGVYFFANGFQECVEMQPNPDQSTRHDSCTLSWNSATNELVPANENVRPR